MIPVEVMGGNAQSYSRFIDSKQGVRQAKLLRHGRKPCQAGCTNLFEFAE